MLEQLVKYKIWKWTWNSNRNREKNVRVETRNWSLMRMEWISKIDWIYKTSSSIKGTCVKRKNRRHEPTGHLTPTTYKRGRGREKEKKVGMKKRKKMNWRTVLTQDFSCLDPFFLNMFVCQITLVYKSKE